MLVCFSKFSPPTPQTSAKVPSQKKASRRKLGAKKALDMLRWPARGPSMLHHHKMTLRHMLFVCVGHRARLLDSGCGSALVALYLASTDVWGVLGSLRFGDALGQDCNQKVVSTPSVAKEICARLLRNGCTPLQTPGKSNVFEFVLRNTMQVFSVVKVWGCRLSVRSCQRQRGRMMSRAHSLIVPRTMRFLGWVNQQMRPMSREHGERRKRECHKTEAMMDRTGTWTRAAVPLIWQMLRNCLLSGSWVRWLFFLVLRFPAFP